MLSPFFGNCKELYIYTASIQAMYLFIVSKLNDKRKYEIKNHSIIIEPVLERCE